MSLDKIRILNKKLLVQIILTDLKRGSLYVPEQKKTCEAVVIKIGEDWNANNIKIGDRVIYDLYAGMEITLADEKYLLLGENDVICTIEA